MKRYLALAFSLCLLANCGPTPTDTPVPATPIPTKTAVPSTPTPAVTVLKELLCEQALFAAGAWLDENRNGIWDTGERPMSDVRFDIRVLSGHPYLSHREALTDDSGEVGFQAIGDGFDGCSMDIEVCAEVPDGYEATTPECQEPTIVDIVVYGFAPLPSISHTPAPE